MDLLAGYLSAEYRDLLRVHVGMQLVVPIEDVRDDPGDAQEPPLLPNCWTLRHDMFLY